MMKKGIYLFLLIAVMCIFETAVSGGEVHWTYSGNEGPEHWGELDAKFSVCSSGKNQSPINLTGMIEGNLPQIDVHYKDGGSEVLNNGHTIQVKYAPDSTITVSGHIFELKQFHFHSPSENTIESHSYPMEAHFVHSDKDGNLAVIAVMFKPGEKNAENEENLHEKLGISQQDWIEIRSLMKAKKDYDLV